MQNNLTSYYADFAVQSWTRSSHPRGPPWCPRYGDFWKPRLSPPPSTTTTPCSGSTSRMATSLLRKRFAWFTNLGRFVNNNFQVLADMSKAGVKPDKETFQCLISRHCQVGDVEGAGKVLQMMKTEGIKVNENIFNSLIMGHGESGDLARAHGMLKVKDWIELILLFFF